MTAYEFQNILFRTRYEMLDAIAGEWLSAGGMNDRETIQQFLAEHTPYKLALTCVRGWGLNLPENDDTAETWLEKRGITFEEVLNTFAAMKANFDKHFPAEEA